MAVAARYEDALQKTLGGVVVDDRFTTWLWLYLKSATVQWSAQPNFGEFRSPQMRDRMAEIIKSGGFSLPLIEEHRNQAMLPKQSFDWITEARWQNSFIQRRLIEQFGYYSTSPDLVGRDLTIAMVDITSNLTLKQKDNLLNNLKLEWNNRQGTQRQYRWFRDDKEKQKVAFAVEVAKKRYPDLPWYSVFIKDCDDLLVFIDAPPFNQADAEVVLNDTKKKWSQQKYRLSLEGKKEQQNFLLSLEAVDLLKELATKHSLKKNQIMELLVRMESEKGVYISEALKRANPL
ncbi:MAG: hypothetical protein V7681_18825 [Halopseudomonas sabulinigri]